MTPEQLRPQHDLAGDQTAEDHDVIQDTTAAVLLRLLPMHRIVELLHSLPVRSRTTILAQAVRGGILTRAGADQILLAITFEDVATRPP